MNTLVCKVCDADGKVTRPIMVEYVDRRSSVRQCLFACWRCDGTDWWPNFVRVEQPHPEG